MSRASRREAKAARKAGTAVVPSSVQAHDDTVAPLPPRQDAPLPPREEHGGHVEATFSERALDRLMAVQRPVVVHQIRALRRRHPDDTPAELIRRIETQYLNTITATGGGAGVTAAVPGIGTAAAIAVTGAETAAFLEMTALFGQAVAEIHGLPVADPLRARTLVMSLILGESAKNVVTQFANQVGGRGAGRQQFWGEIVTKNLPQALVGELSQRLQRAFIKRFAAQTSAGAVGRLVPFGIGAVIGGVGNRILGRHVVSASRDAFGPAPAVFPMDLHPDREVRGDDPADLAKSRRRAGRFFLLPRGKGARSIERGGDDPA